MFQRRQGLRFGSSPFGARDAFGGSGLILARMPQHFHARQQRVLPTIQGAQRDTAWFSILDSEGPAIKSAFERWLAPENFNAKGRRWMRLSELTAEAHRS
jgi:hypothetical protein